MQYKKNYCWQNITEKYFVKLFANSNLTTVRPLFTLLHRKSYKSPVLIVFDFVILKKTALRLKIGRNPDVIYEKTKFILSSLERDL